MTSNINTHTKLSPWRIAFLSACCAIVAIFFSVVNLAELGYVTQKNSVHFSINPLDTTYLVGSENMQVTGEPRYYYTPPGPQAGYLLYKLSAPYPFRYAILDFAGWNNGQISISVSHDGATFTPVFPEYDRLQDGWQEHRLRLVQAIQGGSTLYLRVDAHGEVGKGQTNINVLQGDFILDTPVSWQRIVLALLIGLGLFAGWWLYSKALASLVGQKWQSIAHIDIAAHSPCVILLLYLPLAHRVASNLGGALLFYAVLGVVMIRIYQMIRLIPTISRPRLLAGTVMILSLLTASIVFFRGIILDGDGVGYYMWANSILIDHDLDLANQAKDAVRLMNVGPESELPRWPVTEAVRSPYTTGTSFSQLPFAFLGHLVAKALNHFGATLALDGYTLPYAASVAAGSVLYTFAGFCLLLRIMWKRYRAEIALLSTLGMWFGTVILCMAYLHPASSHGPDLLVTVAFFCVWYIQREQTTFFSWVWRGTLLGLCMWVRQQNIILAGLIIYDALVSAWYLRMKFVRWQNAVRYVLTVGIGVALGFFIMYTPQIVYNLSTCRCLYFGGLENLQLTFYWLTPKIWAVLFGSEHGLFYWTPISLPAVIGLGLLFREDRRLAGGLSLIFAASVYEIGVFGLFGGAGAGQRYLINMTFPLALGLAAFLNYCSRRIAFGWLAAFIGACIILNVGLLSAYALGLIPQMGRGVVLQDFVWATFIQGPARIIEFSDNITYFNKPAFALGAILYKALLGRSVEITALASAIWALALISTGGIIAHIGIFQALRDFPE